MEEKKICYCCGKEIDNDNYIIFNDEIVCADCQETEIDTCECCGKQFFSDDMLWSGETDSLYCNDCYDDLFAPCENCGEYHLIENMYELENGYVCSRCREWYYYICEDCGELVHQDNTLEIDGCIYCLECAKDHKTIINNYYYKPTPIFYGNALNNRFLGVELEIDGAGEDNENAEEIYNIANKDNEHIYIKHDGSLDDGFEIVSHPMTIEYHKSMNWEEICKAALDMGYRSHNGGTCGLHIHVGRNGLGNTFEEAELTTAKILYFVEKHWNYLLKFSRRTQERLDQWAARYMLQDNDIVENYKKIKSYSFSRYVCINLQNTNTIEFRLFRGTLKYNTFIATLEFVNALCDYCVNNDTAFIQGCTWQNFCEYCANCNNPELVQYLDERNIYGTKSELEEVPTVAENVEEVETVETESHYISFNDYVSMIMCL